MIALRLAGGLARRAAVPRRAAISLKSFCSEPPKPFSANECFLYDRFLKLSAEHEALRKEYVEMQREFLKLGTTVGEGGAAAREAVVEAKTEVGRVAMKVTVYAVSGVVSALYLIKELAKSPVFNPDKEGTTRVTVLLTDKQAANLFEICAMASCKNAKEEEDALYGFKEGCPKMIASNMGDEQDLIRSAPVAVSSSLSVVSSGFNAVAPGPSVVSPGSNAVAPGPSAVSPGPNAVAAGPSSAGPSAALSGSSTAALAGKN